MRGGGAHPAPPAGENGWIRERHGRFLVRRRPAAMPLLRDLLPAPDALFSAGEPIRSPWWGPASDAVRIRLGEVPIFLKRYNCLGPLYRLKNILRPSRACHSLLAADRLLRLGVPTPAPLLCLEERLLGTLGVSYLLTELIDGAESLWSRWPQLVPERQMAAVEGLARLIGRLHRCGGVHGDLNWRNFLVRETGSRLEFFLIDLDRARFCRRLQADAARRDLQHFLRDLRRQQVDPALESLFLQRWRDEGGIPPARHGAPHRESNR